jgi:hypothetical protein
LIMLSTRKKRNLFKAIYPKPLILLHLIFALFLNRNLFNGLSQNRDSGGSRPYIYPSGLV